MAGHPILFVLDQLLLTHNSSIKHQALRVLCVFFPGPHQEAKCKLYSGSVSQLYIESTHQTKAQIYHSPLTC